VEQAAYSDASTDATSTDEDTAWDSWYTYQDTAWHYWNPHQDTMWHSWKDEGKPCSARSSEHASRVEGATAGEQADGLDETYEQTDGLDRMVARVIREVKVQLDTPDNRGFVWIDKWSELYSKHFGTLRNFLEMHPDKFTVLPGKGKGFRVASADAAVTSDTRDTAGRVWRRRY